MFWKLVARWISHAPARGNASKASGGSVDAPCCTAPPSPYSLRATRDSSSSVCRSIFTSVRTVPSALTKPPCAVPVWTLLVHVRVLAAHLADFTAYRHRDALRLVLSNEFRELRGEVHVHFLLLRQR